MYRTDTSLRYVVFSWGASPLYPTAGPLVSGLRRNTVSASAQFRRNLSVMRRSVVDYALARRATLASVLSGRTTVTDVCDAHPYLLRAAKFHGEPTDTRCPICRQVKLTHATSVY